MRKTLLALSLAALAGGCGQTSDKALNTEFDENFRASCIAAAARGVVTETVASQVCDCTLAGINEKFSASEKLAMTAEQAKPITAECMRKAGL